MSSELTQPTVVARSGSTVILTSAGSTDELTDAQLWSPTHGYSAVRPLAVHLKFLYYVEEVNPPEPWIEPS